MSPSHRQLMIALGPLPRPACAKDRQHALKLVVSQGCKECLSTKEKPHLHWFYHKIPRTFFTTQGEESVTWKPLYHRAHANSHSHPPRCPPYKHGLHCGYRNFLLISRNYTLGFPTVRDTLSTTPTGAPNWKRQDVPEGQASSLAPNSFLHNL